MGFMKKISSIFKSHPWVLWVLPVLLFGLAAVRPLAIPDEGRYADVARWMWVSGDWLVPRIDGIPFFHKPPMLYWWEMASFALWGATPWAARFVVALHATWMLVLTYVCVRHFAGEQLARRTAWMLGSSMGFLIGGQYVNHDMMVATWIVTAIWCFARAFMAGEHVHQGWARAGFVACALGVMTKGLIGLALPGLVLLVWLIWTAQWRKILALPWFSGLVLFGAIALPWFVVTEQAYPGMLAYMFGKHQFGRYVSQTFNNSQPWWFYLLAITVLMFPWVFWVFAEAGRAVSRLLRRETLAHSTWISLCWIWLLAILVFFSIPNSKLVGYVLPVMPALAILAALAWERSMQDRVVADRIFMMGVVLSMSIAIGVNQYAIEYTQIRSAKGAANALSCRIQDGDVVAVFDDYPYDLMFYANRKQSMEVIQDWTVQAKVAGDDWRRELMDGVPFDVKAGEALQPMRRLEDLKTNPRAWVLGPVWQDEFSDQTYTGFREVYRDKAWVLYQGMSSKPSAAKSPKATEQEGLSRCKDEGEK